MYRHCFAPRCTETLSHLDEPNASPLNAICFMFWDVCVLSYLEDSRDKNALEDAVFCVLEETLRIPHRACIEAGLHGLGEIHCWQKKRVQHIIDSFLQTTSLDPDLHRYTLLARDGDVQ